MLCILVDKQITETKKTNKRLEKTNLDNFWKMHNTLNTLAISKLVYNSFILSNLKQDFFKTFQNLYIALHGKKKKESKEIH